MFRRNFPDKMFFRTIKCMQNFKIRINIRSCKTCIGEQWQEKTANGEIQTDNIVDLGCKTFKLEQGSTEIAQEAVEERIKSSINRPASSWLNLPK